jgi:hypothetical protein
MLVALRNSTDLFFTAVYHYELLPTLVLLALLSIPSGLNHTLVGVPNTASNSSPPNRFYTDNLQNKPLHPKPQDFVLPSRVLC